MRFEKIKMLEGIRHSDLQNPRQLEIVHNGCRVAQREIVPQTERMANFVRHDVSQMVVLLLQIAVRHGIGQDEDVRVKDLPR